MAGFSLFGSAPGFERFPAAPQAPAGGLTLADLYQPAPQPQYPAPPSPLSDLDPRRQGEMRRMMLLLAAQALGQGSRTGEVGTALAGAAAQSMGLRQDMLAQANAEQQQGYAAARAQAEAEAEAQRGRLREEVERRNAEARLALYQKVSQEEPLYAERARVAALAGDDATLRSLAAELPKRAQLRQYGDPDDPFLDERIKGLIEQRQKLDTEKALKAGGYDEYYQEPDESLEDAVRRAGAIAEAQASAYARHRAPAGGGANGRFIESGDRWYFGRVGEDGAPVVSPLDIPQAPYYQIITDERGRSYYVDKNNPAAGRFPIADAPPAASPPPPPSPGKAPGRIPMVPGQRPGAAPARNTAAEVQQVSRALGGLTPEQEAVVRQALARGESVGQVIARARAKRGGK